MSEIQRNPVTCVSVGLDMSLSATGVCVKDGVSIMLDTIKTTPKNFRNDLARLRHIVDATLMRIPANVTMVCIEDYFTPANKAQLGAAIKLVALGTLMRMAMYEKGIPFYVVAAGQIKKFVSGKGSAPKSIIVREVYKRWGVEASDDNQADACVLAHIAEGLMVEVPEGRLKFQEEVLKKVRTERPRYNTEKNDG